jgi:GDPmannose 4,6-dehydratase
LLLAKDYEAHERRASTFNTGRLAHIYSHPHANETAVTLHYGEPSDPSELSRPFRKSSSPGASDHC